jgi:hypothetical protein
MRVRWSCHPGANVSTDLVPPIATKASWVICVLLHKADLRQSVYISRNKVFEHQSLWQQKLCRYPLGCKLAKVAIATTHAKRTPNTKPAEHLDPTRNGVLHRREAYTHTPPHECLSGPLPIASILRKKTDIRSGKAPAAHDLTEGTRRPLVTVPIPSRPSASHEAFQAPHLNETPARLPQGRSIHRTVPPAINKARRY